MIAYYLSIVIKVLFNLLSLAIIVRVLLSWFQVGRHNAFLAFIHDVADPVLDIFKRIIPPIGMLDISPMVALFALNFLEMFLLYLVGMLNF